MPEIDFDSLPRFFATQNGAQNVTNPQGGTVVDDVVTHPNRHDFYLVSQQCTQGTVSLFINFIRCFDTVFDKSYVLATGEPNIVQHHSRRDPNAGREEPASGIHPVSSLLQLRRDNQGAGPLPAGPQTGLHGWRERASQPSRQPGF